MDERYICIHGHFYQPPRENPWLEAVEVQDSAHPYHDWNQRITAECYAPNSAARILDKEGRIEQLVNNYSRMSFDFGPTLLAWMEREKPELYQAILDGDRDSRWNYSGHGCALAQAYNHMILPLANSRDKRTQIIWGIADFQHRFQREPEGMWLPETAVDLETLGILADLGILFTVLAPSQALRIRPLGGGEWLDVRGERIDPTMAYRVNLPSGKRISVFFFDGPISKAIAFDGILSNGEFFVRRLLEGFSEERKRAQLVSVATDGESYGHHHPRGDMALAYALHYIQSHKLARLTNYGEFLERHPAAWEVEILENTSWSCAHGIERWRSDCGCRAGGPEGWNQQWREPLREALDWLRDELAKLFETRGRKLFRDPWEARDQYIRVILDRSPSNVSRFLREHCIDSLGRSQRVEAIKLLEMQRHSMLMYTSCGWFFSEISGLETVQILQYADRALQLAEELERNGLEEGFLKLLERCPSNLPEKGNGRAVFEKMVRPVRVDLLNVGAHYAVSSLFESYKKSDRIFCYSVDQEDLRVLQVGTSRLAVGKIRVGSLITGESQNLSFGVMHLGDHNIWGGVRKFQGKEAYSRMVKEVTDHFSMADLPGTIRNIDAHFGTSTYSLRSLFRDQQRKITSQILQVNLEEAGSLYRQIHQRNAPLIRFLRELSYPVPEAFIVASRMSLEGTLREMLRSLSLDPVTMMTVIQDAHSSGVSLDGSGLGYEMGHALSQMARRLEKDPMDLELLERFLAVLDVLEMMPIEADLWDVQNSCYRSIRSEISGLELMRNRGDQRASSALMLWTTVASKLGIKVG